MGIVYKARQRSLDRIVAVKMLLFGHYTSAEFVHRFCVEASAAASLQHPNIVAVHEVGVHQGQHYFAMDA
jgi:serine/threonine-protein kinase